MFAIGGNVSAWNPCEVPAEGSDRDFDGVEHVDVEMRGAQAKRRVRARKRVSGRRNGHFADAMADGVLDRNELKALRAAAPGEAARVMRYDANADGTIDASEMAAMAADEAKVVRDRVLADLVARLEAVVEYLSGVF